MTCKRYLVQSALARKVPHVRNVEWARASDGRQLLVVAEIDPVTRRSHQLCRLDLASGTREVRVFAGRATEIVVIVVYTVA